jgi:hypothetical protein
MHLNAVVTAYALRRAKEYGGEYGTCKNDPNCVVRGSGVSMGGVLLRYALAWAEDPRWPTVPGAALDPARTSDPVDDYDPTGRVRAKPAGQDTWDLGVGVAVSVDTPHQGANIPATLQGFIKAWEAGGGDTGLGSGTSGFGFESSGWETIFMWGFLQWDGVRNWMVRNRAFLEALRNSPYAPRIDELARVGVPFLLDAFKTWDYWQAIGLSNLLHEPVDSGEFFGPGVSVGVGAALGFTEGLVAGVEWGAVGALVDGFVAYWKWWLITTLIKAGPYGWIAGLAVMVADYFWGVTDLIFRVKADIVIKSLPDSQVVSFPLTATPLLDSAAAKELLYESVVSWENCKGAADLPLLQGNAVDALRSWQRFGKVRRGELCDDNLRLSTTTGHHDAFFTHLGSLNCPGPDNPDGRCGYPSKVRMVGAAFGARTANVSKAQKNVFALHLPYVLSDMVYPLGAHDYEPGSYIGDLFLSTLPSQRLGFMGESKIRVKIGPFTVKKKTVNLFRDYVEFPQVEMAWPFIPTQSAIDLTAPATCSAGLPCCQMLPAGEAKPQSNCCLCTTGLDAVWVAPVAMHHAPRLTVDPCRGANPEAGAAPAIVGLRLQCVASQDDVDSGSAQQMCPGDATYYRRSTLQGIACHPAASEQETASALGFLYGFFVPNLDVTHSCADAQATCVCADGQVCESSPTSCGAGEGRWIWRGGTDRDGDGCPGQYEDPNGQICPTYCETAGQDLDATVVGQRPQGNSDPEIVSVSPTQSFALPWCRAGGAQTYLCSATTSSASSAAPLLVEATASDPDADPVAYFWEFVPDPGQGQTAGDLRFSSPVARQTSLSVLTQNRAPQGSYRVRVTVRDNKGGSAVAETSVVVPGDAPPHVQAVAPASVPEICEFTSVDANWDGIDDDNKDAWRCYVHLAVTGSISDPDGPDSTSILLTQWEDITDRAASGYQAAVFADDPQALSTGIIVYGSEIDVATAQQYPIKLRLTAVDVRGQTATDEVEVVICPVGGCL